MDQHHRRSLNSSLSRSSLYIGGKAANQPPMIDVNLNHSVSTSSGSTQSSGSGNYANHQRAPPAALPPAPAPKRTASTSTGTSSSACIGGNGGRSLTPREIVINNLNKAPPTPREHNFNNYGKVVVQRTSRAVRLGQVKVDQNPFDRALKRHSSPPPLPHHNAGNPNAAVKHRAVAWQVGDLQAGDNEIGSLIKDELQAEHQALDLNKSVDEHRREARLQTEDFTREVWSPALKRHGSPGLRVSLGRSVGTTQRVIQIGSPRHMPNPSQRAMLEAARRKQQEERRHDAKGSEEPKGEKNKVLGMVIPESAQVTPLSSPKLILKEKQPLMTPQAYPHNNDENDMEGENSAGHNAPFIRSVDARRRSVLNEDVQSLETQGSSSYNETSKLTDEVYSDERVLRKVKSFNKPTQLVSGAKATSLNRSTQGKMLSSTVTESETVRSSSTSSNIVIPHNDAEKDKSNGASISGGSGKLHAPPITPGDGRSRIFYAPIAERVMIRDSERCSSESQRPLKSNRKVGNETWECKACKQKYGGGWTAYSCRSSKDAYDVCPNCIIGPGCSNDHVLSPCNPALAGRWSCEFCSRNFSNYTCSYGYGCLPCKFFVCDACYRDIKRQRVAAIEANPISAEQATPPPPSWAHGPHKSAVCRTRSLFVGIDYCRSRAELAGSVNDVNMMLQKLQKALKLNVNDRRVLVDDAEHNDSDGLPTKESILEGLKWLVEGAQPGDVLLWHFSGHGTTLQQEKTPMFHDALVPLDYETAGFITGNEIFKTLNLPALPAGVRFTAVLDGFHSVTPLDLEYRHMWFEGTKSDNENDPALIAKWVRGDKGNPMAPNMTLKNFHSTLQAPEQRVSADVIVLSACHQPTADADKAKKQQVLPMSFETANKRKAPGFAGGACTNALCEVLSQYDGLSYGQMVVIMQEIFNKKGYGYKKNSKGDLTGAGLGPLLSSSCRIELSSKFSLHDDLEVGR